MHFTRSKIISGACNSFISGLCTKPQIFVVVSYFVGGVSLVLRKKKHSVLIICMFWHPTVRSSSATSWLASHLPLSYIFQFYNITELLRTTVFLSEGLKHTKAVGNLKLWRNLSGQFYNNHHTTSRIRWRRVSKGNWTWEICSSGESGNVWTSINHKQDFFEGILLY